MKCIRILLATAAAAAAVTAHAQQGADSHSSHHPAPAAGANAATPQSEGEVRRIDAAQGKVTLRHGPLANLEMPPMTMVFTVTDKKLLEGLKEGDKVRFTAAKKDGSYIVTAMQAAK